MPLSRGGTLDCVQALRMENAGFSPRDLESYTPSPPSLSSSLPPSSPSSSSLPTPLPAIVGSQYISPPADPFTDKEIKNKLNRINRVRRSDVHARISHPLGAIVEYPETGSKPSEAVAHIFSVDPEKFDHPKASFQYSLGDNHGGHSGVYCGLLLDRSNNVVLCNKLRTSCKSVSPFLLDLLTKLQAKASSFALSTTLTFRRSRTRMCPAVLVFKPKWHLLCRCLRTTQPG